MSPHFPAEAESEEEEWEEVSGSESEEEGEDGGAPGLASESQRRFPSAEANRLCLRLLCCACCPCACGAGRYAVLPAEFEGGSRPPCPQTRCCRPLDLLPAGSLGGAVRRFAAAFEEGAYDAEDAALSNVDPQEAARRQQDPLSALDIPSAGAPAGCAQG